MNLSGAVRSADLVGFLKPMPRGDLLSHQTSGIDGSRLKFAEGRSRSFRLRGESRACYFGLVVDEGWR